MRRDGAVPSDPLTDPEAESRSRWTLSERYDVDYDALELISLEHDDTTSSAEFRAPDGTIYSIDLAMVDGLVSISRIRRTPDRTA